MSGSEPQPTLPYGAHDTVPLSKMETDYVRDNVTPISDAVKTEPLPDLQPKRAVGSDHAQRIRDARQAREDATLPLDPTGALPEDPGARSEHARRFAESKRWGQSPAAVNEQVFDWDRPVSWRVWKVFLRDLFLWPVYKAKRLYADMVGKPELYDAEREDDLEPLWWLLGRFFRLGYLLFGWIEPRLARAVAAGPKYKRGKEAKFNTSTGRTREQNAFRDAMKSKQPGIGGWTLGLGILGGIAAIGFYMMGFPPDLSAAHSQYVASHFNIKTFTQAGIYYAFFLAGVWLLHQIVILRQKRLLYLKYLARMPWPLGKIILFLIFAGLVYKFGPGIWAFAMEQ